MKPRLVLLTLAVFLAVAAVWVLLPDRWATSAAGPADQAQAQSFASENVAQVSTLPYTTAVELVSVEPTSLDPALVYDLVGAHVSQSIYEPLIAYNRESPDEFVPLLATGWTVSGDGRTYTFTIRSGVRFHNGAILTAEDVAFSLRRGVLIGNGDSGPQYMIAQGLFNVNDITLLIAPDGSLVGNPDGMKMQPPVLLQAACLTVTQAIAFDNTAGTVTFRLVHPWTLWLDTLAGPWGAVLDKDWSIARDGWDGSCATWQNYYGIDPALSPIATVTNGSGPFVLDHWTAGAEIALRRNPNYWRQAPMWPGGPSGPAALESVVLRIVTDTAVRRDMLLNGQADFADVLGYERDLADDVLVRYDSPDGRAGTLRAYANVLDTLAWDAFFTYDIDTGGPRNYVGSGVLDGNGIPPDFFTDSHVRKAFNYAFDWTRYISNAYGGQAIQRTGPFIKGIIGHADTQPTYFYSPALALQEFGQAWGGQVLSSGFAMTLAYNAGNTTHQAALEILKSGVEGLRPNFHVNVIALPASDYLPDRRASRIPIFTTGWIQDIPHPHNWVGAYLLGIYADRQRLPPDQRAIFQAISDTCLALSGAAARACYEYIQVTTYLSATDIFLAQRVITQFVRAEVQGYYANLALSNLPYFYALSKGSPRVYLPMIRR